MAHQNIFFQIREKKKGCILDTIAHPNIHIYWTFFTFSSLLFWSVDRFFVFIFLFIFSFVLILSLFSFYFSFLFFFPRHDTCFPFFLSFLVSCLVGRFAILLISFYFVLFGFNSTLLLLFFFFFLFSFGMIFLFGWLSFL